MKHLKSVSKDLAKGPMSACCGKDDKGCCCDTFFKTPDEKNAK